MNNAIYNTERGFGMYADFPDMNGERFTVQESSLATEPCVWVGPNGNRGHLTIEQARVVYDALRGWLFDVGAAPAHPSKETNDD